MKRRLLAGLLTCVMLFSLLPATALAEEDDEEPTGERQQEVELSNDINVITESVENAIYNVVDGKAVALKGTKDAPITFTNCTFNISGNTMDIDGSGVGYNGETRTRFGVGEYVTFEGCVFNATDGGTTTTSGNDACIEFFGPGITFSNSSIKGTNWQGQFLGLYGAAEVTFNNSTIATTGNTGGWSYAMYGSSVLNLKGSIMTATGMQPGSGNVNAFYSGDLRTSYDAINITNSTVDFSDNKAGGFAINNVNIHVTKSTIKVNDNSGNACNSGYWIVDKSEIIIDGNRGGHGLSCIGFKMTDSTLEVLHNGYAGVYVQSEDSSFTGCTVDIRCNGERLLGYTAGDVWLNTHTLALKDCEHVWLGAVGRTGSVTAENCPYVVAYDLYENKTKSSTAPVLTGVTLSGQDEHTLLLNRNESFDYARGDTEGKTTGNSNDDDLFADVEKAVAIGANTAKIGTLTTAQLSHHSYDWENGEVTDSATPSAYGVIRYTCTDVCAEHTAWTEEHPYGFDCPGTYVYAPLIGVTYVANAGSDEVYNMPESANDLTYGSKLSTTIPVRDSGTYDWSWTFTGWYADPQCTEKIDEDEELTSNWTIVYAGWEKKEKPAPIVPQWETSKSKTATNLEKQSDGTYTSDVTLSLPAAEEPLVTDVVFVLDKSTSAALEDQALEMLEDLKNQLDATKAKINVGVVIFNKVANVANGGDFYDLSTHYEDIEKAIRQDISSGTNMHAGLLAGKAMLDADTSVDASRKYLIFVSDGNSYMYGAEPTVTAYYWMNDGSPYFSFDNYAWNFKYKNNNAAPDSWATWLNQIGTIIDAETDGNRAIEIEYNGEAAKTLIKYRTPGTAEFNDRTNVPAALATAADNLAVNTYATNVDRSLYYSYQVYAEAQKNGYHCYAMTAASSTSSYAWASGFMEYLAGGKEVSFDEIENDIYYLLDAGSKVVDVIGKGTYGTTNKFAYDFDFVNDAKNLTLTVGKTTYTTAVSNQTLFANETARYTFTADGVAAKNNAEAPFVLHYYANGQDGRSDECFVWDINVPVSQFKTVQLTYTVKLTNPQTEIGVYGVYDKDGIVDETKETANEKQVTLDSLYTNVSATLYPIDSDGNEVQPEDFFRPCVSYTVGETGTLTLTKYVLSSDAAQGNYTFNVTIGDAEPTEITVTVAEDPETGIVSGSREISVPFGDTYTVEEVTNSDYTPKYLTKQSGTITLENPTATVAVANVCNNEAALFISKTVSNGGSTTQKFTFTVELTDTNNEAVTGTLVYTGSDAVTTFESGKTVTLTSGNSATIYGLPAGVKYKVTEASVSNYTTTYTVTGVDGTKTGNIAEGTISRGTVAGVHYTNTYTKPSTPSGGSSGGGSTVLNTDDHYSYIIGYKDGTLRPYGTITRGEVATIFFRLLTDEARDKNWSQTNDYSDCNSDLWCNNAISTLSNMGIIDGYTDGTFRPYGKITRAQFAKIAVGFFETTKKEYQGYYSDVPENAWFTDYVEAASRVGLIQGFEDGTFRPNTNITRAQACVIVNRALNRKPDEDHLLPEKQMVTWPDNNPGDWYYADMQEATNSHDYTWLSKGSEKKYMEDWTKKLEQRDWAAFEHAWSTAHSAPGGEVVK